MNCILFALLVTLFTIPFISAEELLENGSFETGDITGWNYWETYPWDGDGAPVESPTNVTIAIPGEIGTPAPLATSGILSLAQQINSYGTARGGLYQEVKVTAHTPYLLTGHMAFYGDDSGDITLLGILDSTWNPAHALTTHNKASINGNPSSWIEVFLAITPSKNVLTVFTETRQDWLHGHAAGWYDNLSLLPAHEKTKYFASQHPKKTSINDNEQKQMTEKKTR
ncbi:MAG: hypothetical protein MRJ65_11770 [Candidatus Brocadiaceae bacterium]|nr:hypothetical protein [Candidatus Brocadiaceae bacterium]